VTCDYSICPVRALLLAPRCTLGPSLHGGSMHANVYSDGGLEKNVMERTDMRQETLVDLVVVCCRLAPYSIWRHRLAADHTYARFRPHRIHASARPCVWSSATRNRSCESKPGVSKPNSLHLDEDTRSSTLPARAIP
jgi:hypothetical protein